jgi:ribosome modulation factor
MKINRIGLPILALALGTSGLAMAAHTPTGSSSAQYGQGQGGWDAPPQEFRDIQRQGYHDGIEGARKDYDNHRRPDVNNRDEYRHPHVPASARDDYREGFRRGYQAGMSHLSVGH